MKKLIAIGAATLCVCVLWAQHEVGLGFGTAHLLGDFGGGLGRGTIFIKDLDPQSTKPSASLFYRYNFLKILAMRGQFTYAGLSSNDIYSAEQSRFERGLNSKTRLMVLSVQIEVHLLPLKPCRGSLRVSPYIAAGLGVLRANPNIMGQGGEGFSTNESQYINDSGLVSAVNIPFAAGVKIKTAKKVTIGLEASYRMAFTDRLDNYIRQQNDHFIFLQTQVSYVFCRGVGGGRNKEVRCPTY